jgi:hypothetical protein
MIPDSFTDHIHVNAWTDPVIDELGHDPRSQYVEWFWLAVLGPSTVWLLRRLGDALDHAPDGFTLDVHECAAALGIGGASSRRSAMQRTLRRTVQFGVARAHNDHVLDVRRRLPPLNRAQVLRLPSSLLVAHDDWTRAELQRHEAARATAS